jgi:hypothetical protein
MKIITINKARPSKAIKMKKRKKYLLISKKKKRWKRRLKMKAIKILKLKMRI